MGIVFLIFTTTAMMGTIGILRNIGVAVFSRAWEEEKVKQFDSDIQVI
jgi:hypothetical protein